MGISASSLLDESKSNYIKGRAEADLQEFSPHYRRQYSVASFSKVQEELQQGKTKITRLLLQRAAPEEGAVLYEDNALYFDENRKWKERYMVVRANYCLECHDSFESFMKGVLPSQRLLPTGGTVLTTEEKYMAMVDKCFPEEVNNLKEDFAPPSLEHARSVSPCTSGFRTGETPTSVSVKRLDRPGSSPCCPTASATRTKTS
ncbi:protein Niban 1a [Osmerus eperlanus]|uniref:protein Niban 1a n=1 Tax=Osmerus eperlanus TaxID=29151 RepID=UPI002E135603